MKKKIFLPNKILLLIFFIVPFVSQIFAINTPSYTVYNVNGNVSYLPATCSNNGSIIVTASGSTVNPSLYVFTITNGPTSNGQTYPFSSQFHESTFTFMDLYPGMYEVTIEDAGDPSNPAFVGNVTVVDETEVLDFSTNSTSPNCPGEHTGTLSFSVSSGVGPYQYQILDGPSGTTTAPISDSSTSYTFNSLPSGNYRVRVYDGCGDFQTRNHTISSPSSSSVFLNGRGISRISCTEAIYRVDAFGSGSYTYNVVGGAPSGYSSTNTTGEFTLPINQAPYTFSVTGSCGQTDTYTYNNPTSGVTYSASNKKCTVWDLSLNPSWMVGPYIYTLTSTPAGYSGVLSNNTGDFYELPYGNFSYTVSDSCGNVVSGNGDVQSDVIQINPITDAEGDTCNPGLGSVVVYYNNNEAIGPITFELTTFPSGFSGNAGPKNGNVFDELEVGNYEVTATDACGNIDTHTFEFEADDALSVDFDIDVIQGCVDSHSVKVSVTSNVSSGFGAKWFRLRDAATGNLVKIAASFSGPATFNNVSGGEYYIEYDIFAGCSVYSDNFQVQSYEQPRLVPLSSYTCANNGFVTVSGITDGGVGPFTYSLINTANNQVLATNTECYFSNQDALLSYAVRIEDNCGNSSSAQVSPVAVGLGLEFQGETCASLGESFPFYLREYTGVNYDWTFPDGSTFNGSDPREIIGTITTTDFGVYTVVASTSDGCRTQTLTYDFQKCPLPPVDIDFDGVDDYLDATPYITNWTAGTIMAWVKIEHTSSGNLPSQYSIAGQENMRLYITNGRTPAFYVITQRQVTASSNYPSNNIQIQPDPIYNIKLQNDLWYHLTGVFSAADQTVKLYLNGKLVGTTTDPDLNSELITKNFNGSPHIYSTREFTIGRYPTNTSVAGFGHFNGNIDEVRVFDSALTDNQIQQMVYQEIENNSGNVRGTIIPKDIQDFSNSEKVLWSNLQGYYPMTDITGGKTIDYSGKLNDVTLHNITTVQDQTAPMPYATISDGAWTSESTWLHGDVWDIEDVATNKDWSIVDIQNNISANHEIKTLGLFIDHDKTLTIQGDNLVENSWYFELNGTIDLEDDSQLVQTITSDLVTSSEGKILRRQEGTSNPYWYNYWSSPIGVQAATSLIDNNAVTNNTNNTDFSLNMLKDDSGSDFMFTSGYTANGNISTYWIYNYINGLTYWDWAHVSTSTALKPGVGYTQKGTGVGGTEQQYLFEGKPNNGTILIDVDDVGGTGSVANQSKTEYLLGNPYPSALDIHKFIDDNEGVIKGSLQLWQQWGGNSHVLNEYQGGYAQVNKTGSIRAYQFVSFYGAHNGSQDGTKIPTRYLPVGQGFIAEIENDGVLPFDGTVEFNNSQRVFIKESDVDPLNDQVGSVFSKTTKGKTTKGTNASKTTEEAPMQRMRLEFNSVTGPATRHELLLGFSEYTTDGYDYGYDAENLEASNNDLNLSLEDMNMNIQAYGEITNDKVVPLNFRSSDDNTFEIRVSGIENIDSEQSIYLRDNLTGTYFDLTQGTAYSFSSEQGIFNNRFQIVFQNEQQSLRTETSTIIENNVYFQNTTNTLFAKKLSDDITKLSLISMHGQSVLELTNVSRERLEGGIQFNTVSTGTYVVCMRTSSNELLTKKIIINKK